MYILLFTACIYIKSADNMTGIVDEVVRSLSRVIQAVYICCRSKNRSFADSSGAPSKWACSACTRRRMAGFLFSSCMRNVNDGRWLWEGFLCKWRGQQECGIIIQVCVCACAHMRACLCMCVCQSVCTCVCVVCVSRSWMGRVGLGND